MCNKQISNRANLKKHLKIRHSEQEEATCPYCLKLFRNKYSLWTHINSYHPGAKNQNHHLHLNLSGQPPPSAPSSHHQSSTAAHHPLAPPTSSLQFHLQQEYLHGDGSDSGSLSAGDNPTSSNSATTNAISATNSTAEVNYNTTGPHI